jgi:hypothetical protein
METLSFTLGVLSVIATVLAVVVVWSFLMVLKQQKQIKLLNTELDDRLNSLEHVMHARFDDQDRLRDDRIDYAIDHSKSYTDSRIDKLVTTYFGLSEVGRKQLIKS